MKNSILISLLFVSVGFGGCIEPDDVDDSQESWDTGADTESDTDTNLPEDGSDYLCIDDSKPVDEEACGPYPAASDQWDLYAVVPEAVFKAFHDRDCDGTVEETTLDLYRDIYCQRDKVKSLVLVVGSYCGEDTGIT